MIDIALVPDIELRAAKSLQHLISDITERKLFGIIPLAEGYILPLALCVMINRAPDRVGDILVVNKEVVPKGLSAQDVITAMKIACDVSDWYSQKACPIIRKL